TRLRRGTHAARPDILAEGDGGAGSRSTAGGHAASAGRDLSGAALFTLGDASSAFLAALRRRGRIRHNARRAHRGLRRGLPPRIRSGRLVEPGRQGARLGPHLCQPLLLSGPDVGADPRPELPSGGRRAGRPWLLLRAGGGRIDRGGVPVLASGAPARDLVVVLAGKPECRPQPAERAHLAGVARGRDADLVILGCATLR